MTMANALPISRLIQVGVVLTPQAAQMQNLNTLLVLGSSNVIDTSERIRNYSSLPEVASDFGNASPEYYAAVDYFGQSPQPTSLSIGRWAKTASSGQLVGSTLSTAQQALSVWTAVTSGGFEVTIDGGSAQNVASLNFSNVTNLNGVASVINAVLTGAVVTWNSNFSQFIITSNSTGTTSAVGFAIAPISGTDISGMLGLTVGSSGSYSVPGIAAETAISAVTTFDANFGQSWYALFICGASDSDHQAVGAYIEASNTRHLYGISTQEAGVLTSSSTTDIAYVMKSLGYNKTLVQFSSSSAYAVCSLLGRAIVVDYNGNSTAITLMYKAEPGVIAETLNTTQMSALESKNCNVYVAYDNDTTIIEPGKVASGQFIDTITDVDWFVSDLQTTLFNALYTSPTKIPQTDAGNHVLLTNIEQVCGQAVTNGTAAPGQWNSAGFGTLSQGDFLPKGFYVYAPPISSQSQADRAARISVPFQVALKLAGAIHDVVVGVVVNQ